MFKFSPAANNSIANQVIFDAALIFLIGLCITIWLWRARLINKALFAVLIAALFFIVSLTYDSSLAYRWTKLSAEHGLINLHLADETEQSFTCSDIVSVMPRFEKGACYIDIKTKNEVFVSPSIEDCKDATGRIKTFIDC